MNTDKPLSSPNNAFFFCGKSLGILKEVRQLLSTRPELQASLVFYIVDKFIPELEEHIKETYKFNEGETIE